MNEYYIYITTNNINGKQYIGQHKGQPNDNYLGSGTTIKKALKKYGKENFSKEILCYCQTREEADEKEKFYISLFDAVNDNQFYNNAEGGQGGDGWRACHKWLTEHPEEAQKIYQENGKRLQQWGKNHPQEFQEKVVAPMLKGAAEWRKTHPEEVQQRMIKVNGAKQKWQQEHSEEYQTQVNKWRQAGSEANSQKILCVTTGEIFPSQCEAARTYKIQQGNISKCLKGERKSAGKDPKTGAKLIWQKI